MKYSYTLAALAASVAADTVSVAQSPPTRVLAPIRRPNRQPLVKPRLTQDVHLEWGSQDTSYVDVSLSMKYPSVVLEAVEGVTEVDCDANSVAVTFGTDAALQAALADWNEADDFVLITNHLGDCDAELERGFFLGGVVTPDAEKLVLNVTAEKTDVENAAANTVITFSNIPATPTENKRAIKVGENNVSITGEISLPSPVTLYQYDPYVIAKANSAHLAAGLTLSGYLEYQILSSKLSAFYVDIDTSLEADLALEVDVKAAYTQTFSYSTGSIGYDFVNIPGIIKIGPAIEFDIGVDLGAQGAVTVTGAVGAEITKGNIHLDFVNTTNTTTSGWTPTYSAGLNISEKAGISVDPFVDLTVELAFELLGGALDLSGGVTAQPRFNNDFTLTAAQEVNTTDPISQPGTACDQGVRVVSEFQFSVIAFVTQFWKDTVYSVSVPIADKCYSWL